ncbi:hypothetical protein evm_015519 [Chilo suppressalis]|nr:hypothetical protein evm_015519 [Chilo suppressalis]
MVSTCFRLHELVFSWALEEKDGVKKSDTRPGPPPACTVVVTPTEVISVRDSLDLSFVTGAAAYLKDRGSEALLKGTVHGILSAAIVSLQFDTLVTPTEVISVRDTLDLSFVTTAAAYLKDRGSEALLKDTVHWILSAAIVSLQSDTKVTPTEVISVRDSLDLSFVTGAAAYLKDRGSEALLKGTVYGILLAAIVSLQSDTLVTPTVVISLRYSLDLSFLTGAAAYLKDRGSEALLKGAVH